MGLPKIKPENLPNYTYDDYVQWEGRWELIHGIPYAMVPAPTIDHQEVSGNIFAQLHRLLKGCNKCKSLLPVDWQISKNTIVQPDNLVICGDNPDNNKLTIPPVLIFEIISPSSRRKDCIIKYQLYRDAGVKYYCLVDPEEKTADVFTLYQSQYRETGRFKEGKITFDLGPCSIDFDFYDIFDI